MTYYRDERHLPPCWRDWSYHSERRRIPRMQSIIDRLLCCSQTTKSYPRCYLIASKRSYGFLSRTPNKALCMEGKYPKLSWWWHTYYQQHTNRTESLLIAEQFYCWIFAKRMTQSRNFLFEVMRYFRFAYSFIPMIWNLHNNTTARFVVNEMLSDPIPVLTGIRQASH